MSHVEKTDPSTAPAVPEACEEVQDLLAENPTLSKDDVVALARQDIRPDYIKKAYDAFTFTSEGLAYA